LNQTYSFSILKYNNLSTTNVKARNMLIGEFRAYAFIDVVLTT